MAFLNAVLMFFLSFRAMAQNGLPVEKKILYMPPLTEIAEVLNSSLTSNFKEVRAEVVDCPDLTQQPFTLASSGLGGRTAIADIGGPPYLLPLVQRDKVYDLRDTAKLVGFEEAFLIGAGAGPFPYAGTNCEGIFNVNIKYDTVEQHTRISKVNVSDGTSYQEVVPNKETRYALLANFFLSQGIPGKVLRVYAKKRIGQDDFVASIRKSLAHHYGDKLVGLGGAFLLKEGKVKQHVMPDFSKTALVTEDNLNAWLHFYNMSAPLIAVGTLVSGDCDLDLRVQHFHSFSHHNEAGHYHIDTTPETVEYLGYFNIGEALYRIDRPVMTHHIGRD